MLRKHILITVLVLLAVRVSAQQSEKNEIAGTVGRTFVADHVVAGIGNADNMLRTGNGLTFEGTYGRHIWSMPAVALTAEVPFAFDPTQKLHVSVAGLVPESYKSFFVAPALRANFFPTTVFSPWVSFGGGFGHFSASSKLLFGGTNSGTTSSTTGVLQIGAGLDVRVAPRWSVRLEFRDFDSGVPPVNVDTGNTRQHNLYGGGGVIWHF